ncbi:hypothetical protein FRC15_006081 [Serendipita sp. 397]|nr:hypothetical protein FRC15_006081 [Serendipita sp. 397]
MCLPRLLAIGLILSHSLVSAFYLPGAAPKDYRQGEDVEVDVNVLKPGLGYEAENLRSLLNYDYYDERFDFCKPESGVRSMRSSLGAILFGDRIFNGPIKVKMNVNETCKAICGVTVEPQNAKFIDERIREDYSINWLVDGLPAGEVKEDTNTGEVFYDLGFDLGNKDGSLNNHYEIVIKYHVRPNGFFRVVGVTVWPSSLHRPTTDISSPQCGNHERPLKLSEVENSKNKFYYTYSVNWEESSTVWATRWDNYLRIYDPRIHTFSLINSLVMVIFLCALVSSLLLKTVKGDISRYNAIDLDEDVQEDYGWKLVHGEVFRTPKSPILLSVLVGNGTQLCAMIGVTLVFATLGFLSPSNRGALATVMLMSWTFFGIIGGYMATRTYMTMGGTDQRKLVFLTSFLLPTFIFAVVFILNLILIFKESSGAVPFGTMLVIVILWFAISVPLISVGAWLGKKHGGLPSLLRVNQIPRQIPPPPKYLRPVPSILATGILPFGAAFIEGYFLFSSIFAARAYYAFGFLAMTSGVVALTTATVTILFVYFLLCAEDYRWHWRSFIAGGGSAVWLLIYGTYYWLSRLSLDSFASTILYFGYLIILASINFIVTGTIGFLAATWAVRRLYSAVRID